MRGISFTPDMATAVYKGTKWQTRRPVKPGAVSCSYGAPGSRLYVKENWRPLLIYSDRQELIVQYADRVRLLHAVPDKEKLDLMRQRLLVHLRNHGFDPDENLAMSVTESLDGMKIIKWNAPLFMPQWVSRTILEIKSIRLERIHDLTEEDAMAEGFRSCKYFANKWQSLYKDSPHFCWSSNPLVWVLEFDSTPKKNKP